MTCKELADELLKTPDQKFIVLDDYGDWVEVFGVRPTGVHRDAVTVTTKDPATGTVAVCPPDAKPPQPKPLPKPEVA